jgi:excinuclease UvrABC ATPase subunit
MVTLFFAKNYARQRQYQFKRSRAQLKKIDVSIPRENCVLPVFRVLGNPLAFDTIYAEGQR